MEDRQQMLRQLPAMEKLLQAAEKWPAFEDQHRNLIAEALRGVLAKARSALKAGAAADISEAGLLQAAATEYEGLLLPGLRRVINATGITLHTNLGRAPLSQRAQRQITEVAQGYNSLEYDLTRGERGSRYAHVEQLICRLTGAEAALVVNNNAAAVILTMAALARGREVIVSRGELVEIGGSFRMPEVIEESGARLVEVGTTNKTHLADYRRAITGETAVLLKVHTSNYRIVGFAAQPAPQELSALAREAGLPVVEDLGSGTLLPIGEAGWQEPMVAQRLAAGLDIVTFSGDKLLGAGQAGIIAGKKQYVDQMKKHPLLRALRIDKLSLAALEGTLRDYLYGNPQQDIPVWRMLSMTEEELRQKAVTLHTIITERLPGGQAAVIPTRAPAGGGSLPASEFAGYSVTVTLTAVSASQAEGKLRRRKVPVICRVQDGQMLFDVRCLEDADMEEIAQALAELG